MEFRKKIENGETLHGTIVTLGLPSITEMLSECGFDWLWIDMEHAPFSLREVQGMIQAKKRTCAAVVRIPCKSEEWIKRTLDLGVDGLIIPHVNTAKEVEFIVEASCYPPQGTRSAGMARASLYGIDTKYALEANSKHLLFVQIEHYEGVANIEEIVRVEGLDGVIIGPYDLSGSFGKLGQIDDPEVAASIAKVLSVCQRVGKPIGIFAKDSTDAKRRLTQGFQLIAMGVDAHYLWSSAREALDQLLA